LIYGIFAYQGGQKYSDVHKDPCDAMIMKSATTKTVHAALMIIFWMRISKKYFCLGGMAPSEWTRSVRAIRDTLVVNCSGPGLNTTRRVAYRLRSLFHRFFSLCRSPNYKRTLWQCGQL
jgi:hypothetical protein